MERFCRRFTKQLESAVAEVACAIRYTVIALITVVAGYLLLHVIVNRWQPPPGWTQVLSRAGDATNHAEATGGGITRSGSKETDISDDGTFTFHFRDDILNRYFARDKINEWKQHEEEQARQRSAEVLPTRRTLLRAAITFAYETYGRAQALAFFPKDPTAPGADNTITDDDYLRMNLTTAVEWLQTKAAQVPAILPPEKRAESDAHIEALKRQDMREDAIRRDLAEQVRGLKPVLSFDWMFIEGSWWIIEVIFWCLFGVLAKTLIRLIAVGRLPPGHPDGYKTHEFLLFIPKAVLAPLLAVIVVSWWATGYSESKINFANLPYLLVFFFMLGFMTETIYTKLTELGNIIVTPAAKASQEKLEEAAKLAVYQFRSPQVTGDDPEIGPVRTISQLATAAKAVAASALERGVVTRQVQKDPNTPTP